MVEPYRILIVEDDPEHADLIKMGFRKHDEFFLDFASTGEDGLEMIGTKSYDLISVDLVLPGIGGLDVLIKIRKFDQDIPVVIVSGQGTTELAVVAFENRATKYVVKSMESYRSLPYIFENLIQEARFKASERVMRERIEKSERIHRNVVENALAGIYILQDGQFKLVNPKLGEIFGCDQDKLIGMPFWQLVQPDDMECVSKLERGREGPAPAYESKILRKDGGRRWIEFRTVPIEYENRRAVLGNLVDITQRKELEIELLRSNRELASLNNLIMRVIQPEGDLSKDLDAALSDIISGIDGAELGGIFLLEGQSLVLQSLFGSVEDLISFINEKEPEQLTSSPRVHASGKKDFTWITSPISCSERTRGVVVIASLPALDSDGMQCLSFLDRSVPHIGRILDACSLRSQVQSSNAEVQLVSQADSEKSGDL